MNKRQAKKQYKKIHGHNPQSAKRLKAAERNTTIEYTLTPEQLEAAVKTAKKAFSILARELADAANAIADTFNRAADNLESEG